jgi:hypothetical protein
MMSVEEDVYRTYQLIAHDAKLSKTAACSPTASTG